MVAYFACTLDCDICQELPVLSPKCFAAVFSESHASACLWCTRAHFNSSYSDQMCLEPILHRRVHSASV